MEGLVALPGLYRTLLGRFCGSFFHSFDKAKPTHNAAVNIKWKSKSWPIGKNYWKTSIMFFSVSVMPFTSWNTLFTSSSIFVLVWFEYFVVGGGFNTVPKDFCVNLWSGFGLSFLSVFLEDVHRKAKFTQTFLRLEFVYIDSLFSFQRVLY